MMQPVQWVNPGVVKAFSNIFEELITIIEDETLSEAHLSFCKNKKKIHVLQTIEQLGKVVICILI